MSDMMGSVSGKHTDDFTAAGKQLGSIATSSQGQGLASAMTAVLAAITSGSGLSAALTALTNASSSFATQAANNSSLKGALSSISGSMSNVTGHISLENSNLSLAGLALNAMPANPLGSAQILSFASKLHSFGVDKQQLGHNDIFNGVATDSLTGDSLKAALLEGKNVAAMAAVGKTPPSVSNQTAALSDSNDSNIDSFIQTFQSALNARNQAVTAANQAKTEFININNQYKANPSSTGLSDQWDTAKANCISALQAQTAAIDAFDQAKNKMYAAADAASDSTKTKVAGVLSDAISNFVQTTRLTTT
jgi:hypothetical protein